MDKYPTSYEEDLKILEQEEKEQTLTYNQKNCVLYRFGEK